MSRVKFQIEFILRASPTIVYQFLTEPACLVRWFCDDADIEADYYVFGWNGSSQYAEVIEDIEEEVFKIHFLDSDDDEFLKFRIYRSEVTDQTILEITDFCDKGEEKDYALLWESQINNMKKGMGTS